MGKENRADLADIWFYSAIKALSKVPEGKKKPAAKVDSIVDLCTSMKAVAKSLTGEDYLLGKHLRDIDFSSPEVLEKITGVQFESNKVRKALITGLANVAKHQGQKTEAILALAA